MTVREKAPPASGASSLQTLGSVTTSAKCTAELSDLEQARRTRRQHEATQPLAPGQRGAALVRLTSGRSFVASANPCRRRFWIGTMGSLCCIANV